MWESRRNDPADALLSVGILWLNFGTGDVVRRAADVCRRRKVTMEHAFGTYATQLGEGADSNAELRKPAGRHLRVALFSGNYNYTRDGANRALNMLVGHLLKLGAKVRGYSPTTDQPAFEAEGDLVSVPSIALPHRREFRLALGLPAFIKDDIRRFQPNLIHLSAPDWLGCSAQRFARLHGIPTVASMHTRFETYLDYYRLGFLRPLVVGVQRRFYNGCDRVLAPNDSCKSHLVSMGIHPARVALWGRGVDPEMFSPRKRDLLFRRGLGFDDDEPVLLFLGRLVREKGLDCFIGTVNELKSRGMPARLIVIGDGPELASMRAELSEAVFLGHLEGQELGRAISSADILLNPSTTEAFGNVNLEAMSAGLLVVSADAPSARTLISHNENGFLCPADPIQMASLLETIMQDRFRGAVIRQRAVNAARSRSWSATLNNVIETYDQMLLARERRPVEQ